MQQVSVHFCTRRYTSTDSRWQLLLCRIMCSCLLHEEPVQPEALVPPASAAVSPLQEIVIDLSLERHMGCTTPDF